MSIESIKQNKWHYGVYNICKSKMHDNSWKIEEVKIVLMFLHYMKCYNIIWIKLR